MEADLFDDMQRDIPGTCGNPDRIVAHPGLDREYKAALLKQCKFGLRQPMAASDENVTDKTAEPGHSAELHRSVK